MKATALIAEDEPLLAAELEAQLLRLWPEGDAPYPVMHKPAIQIWAEARRANVEWVTGSSWSETCEHAGQAQWMSIESRENDEQIE